MPSGQGGEANWSAPCFLLSAVGPWPACGVPPLGHMTAQAVSHITWYQTWQPTALPSASMVVRELPATLGTLGTAPAQEENQLVQRRALSRTPGPPGAAPFSPPYPSWGGGDPAAPRHSPSLESEVLLSSTSARTQPEPAPPPPWSGGAGPHPTGLYPALSLHTKAEPSTHTP